MIAYEQYVNGFREIYLESPHENVSDILKEIIFNIWSMEHLTVEQKVEIIALSHQITETIINAKEPVE